MFKHTLTAILSLFTAFSQAQNTNTSPASFRVEKSAVIHPREIREDRQIHLQNLEMPGPGSTGYRSRLMAFKQAQQAKYPVRYGSANTQRGGMQEPVVGMMMEGNLMDNGVPNDNDIAISDEGFIVSVINSNILMYDSEADTLMRSVSLGAFTLPLNIQQSKFDPKIVYDAVADRFILVFLNGSSYQSSKVIVCFSTSSNPMDPWNLYKLSGNPLQNNTWSDYPVIGISQHDLFIGVNTFYNGSQNNSGFLEGCLWQIALTDGYHGDTLRTAYYHDITAPGDTLFNITPIHRGAENLNADMFFLSNKNLSPNADSIYLLHIDSPIINGNPQLTYTLIQSQNSYGIPPTAQQPGGHFFDTNDSRILGGFIVGDRIQFVQCTMDTTTGLSAIYHGFVYDVYGSPYAKANLVADPSRFLGYPNIAWVGMDNSEAQAIISFNYVSSTEPGGTGTILFRNDSTYSNFTTLKTGNSFVNVISGTDERWGDYSGIQRRYNEPCRVWAAGTFAKSTNSNGTWIAEIGASDTCAVNPISGINPLSKKSTISTWPNPAAEQFTMEFELEESTEISVILSDLNGKQVEILLSDVAKKGKNRFSFSTSWLSNGIYVLHIRSKNGIVGSQRIVVAH